MAGLKGQGRVPRTDPRIRRNSQNLASNFTAFSGAISLNDVGEIILSINAAGGLVQTDGLAVNFGTGLQIVANVLKSKDSEIVHDNLSGFVADEHITHSGVSINTTAPLAGGGTIAATRTLTLSYSTGLYLDGTILKADHDAATNFVADEHIAHASVSISTTAPLAGGGTIAATRTLTLNYSTGLYLDGATLKADHDAATNFVADEHIDWTNTTRDFLTTGKVQGKLIMRTVASDPQDVTPENRPVGDVAEVVYYTGKLYFCTNSETPLWELITSS